MIKHISKNMPEEVRGKTVKVIFANGLSQIKLADDLDWGNYPDDNYKIVEWEILKAAPPDYKPPSISARPNDGMLVKVTYKNGETSSGLAEHFNWGSDTGHDLTIVRWETLPHLPVAPTAVPPAPELRSPSHIEAIELLRRLAEVQKIPAKSPGDYVLTLTTATLKIVERIVNEYDDEIVGTLPDGYQMSRKTEREFKQWLIDREAPKCGG